MTKSLEELLGVDHIPRANSKPHDTVVNEDYDDAEDVDHSSTDVAVSEYDKIASSLPMVNGLGKATDRELNEISIKAVGAYDDLMDLGMNVEQRYSGRIFEIANSLLKTGLDARVAKLNKRLKVVELQLRKEKQDSEEKDRDRRAAQREEKSKIVPEPVKTTKANSKSDDKSTTKNEGTNQEKTSEVNSYVVTDRNSLLEQLNQLSKQSGSDQKE